MPPTRKEIIQRKAVEILDANPKGIRYTDLVAQIAEALPEIPKNTVHGNVWKLDVLLPAQVYKPARGVTRARTFSGFFSLSSFPGNSKPRYCFR